MTTADNFHIFSDEEGMAPFQDGKYHPYLEKIFDFENGIISGVKSKNDKLVFLGDLMDHGTNERRLLDSMIRLHDADRAVLIAGNRDVNKIRMGVELQIVDIDSVPEREVPLKLEGVNTLDGLWVEAEKIISNRQKYHYRTRNPSYLKEFWKKPIDGSNPSDVVHVDDGIQFDSDDVSLDRIRMVYSKTMGVKYDPAQRAQNYGFDLTEKLRERNDQRGIDPTPVFMALLQCILAGGQSCPALVVDGVKLEGLYMRYLRRCKIVDLLETSNGKRVLVGHAGVPNTLSHPMGVENPPETNSKLSDVCAAINSDLEKSIDSLLKNIQVTAQNDDGGAISQAIDTVAYYVAMSATSTESNKVGMRISGKNSPIVSRKCIDDAGHRTTRYASGGQGGWLERYTETDPDSGQHKQNRNIIAANTTDPARGGVVDYVLFGHTPQGHAPTVWKERDSSTTFACVDVSKAPGTTVGPFVTDTANYFTHAVLSIGKDGDFVTGAAQLKWDEMVNNRIDIESLNSHPGVQRADAETGVCTYQNAVSDYPAPIDVDGKTYRWKFGDLFHTMVGFTNEYIQRESAVAPTLPSGQGTDIVMIACNGSGGFTGNMKSKISDAVGAYRGKGSVMIGFDGDAPNTIPHMVVLETIRSMGRRGVRVEGVIQVQGHNQHSNPDYVYPKPPIGYGFQVPVFTYMYYNGPGAAPESPPWVTGVVEIDALGIEEGKYGGFDESGRAEGSTAAWMNLFAEGGHLRGFTRHLMALWDETAGTKQYEGSITQRTVNNVGKLVGAGHLYQFTEPRSGGGRPGGGRPGNAGAILLLAACTAAAAFLH
eukprot:jgi/Tetstr1/464091/TSEL_008896.t1